jgi:hypothetical protein
MSMTEQIRNGIFAGESGGDYDAVFGFQNRPGGKYERVRLTEMPISAVIEFTDPRGEYGQWVKSQVGRVATPVGAYQVVGTTLRQAVKALGLDPNRRFDKDTQDLIGDWIYANQGTDAWEGYKGPSGKAPSTAYATAPRDRQAPAERASDPAIRLAWAYANGKMSPEDEALYEQGVAAGDFPPAKKKERPTESAPLATTGALLTSLNKRREAPVPIDLNFMTRRPLSGLGGI